MDDFTRHLPDEHKLRLRIGSLAVGLQHLSSRISHEQFAGYRQSDAICFALILRQFLRTIEALNRRVGSKEVTAALANFYSTLPHEKEFRDVLEHFDEYEIGEGRLQREQRKAGKNADMYWIWYQDDGMSFTLKLGDKLSLDIENASEAAYELSVAVREPFDRALHE